MKKIILIGQKIGNYKIVREIGYGGMGAVYLANEADGKFEQKVALKLLKREMNTAALAATFSAGTRNSRFVGTSEYRAAVRCRNDRRQNSVSGNGICRRFAD